MTWQLDRGSNYEIFQRNSLVTVIVDLRFATILSAVKDGVAVAKFQSLVRLTFPEFALETGTVVDIGPERISQTQQEQLRFSNKSRGCSLVLSPTQLTLEANDHKSRTETIGDFEVALKALRSLHDPIAPIRFGIRYINIIDKRRISQDLGRAVTWDQLIHSDFLAIPRNMANLDGTYFQSEINASMDLGRLVLRYGLLPSKDRSGAYGDEDVTFRFDSDRSIEGAVDLDSLGGTAVEFVSDIYDTFSYARSDALTEWMNGTVKELTQ